ALIGNTPLVRLETLDTGRCELFVKLESQNPGGSIKDRIGLAMIEAAEQSGTIRPGATLVDATAGDTGLALALVARRKGYRLVLAGPAGSVLAGYVAPGKIGEAGSWLVEGIGEDFVPPICDLSRVRHTFTIGDEESFLTARALLRDEGILGGSSSGTLVAAALRYCRAQASPRRVVTFVCDSGSKYLSKMYNDFWMQDQGFLRGARRGDLRD